MREIRGSVCRTCHAACDLSVEIEDGAILSVHGRKDNPVTFGYSCIKGRESGRVLGMPSRLRHSMRRTAAGGYEPVSSGDATREIGEKLKAIVAEHGPAAVALYIGSFGFINVSAFRMSLAFMEAVGSPMVFDTSTIDQPGKAISAALHGTWLAGLAPVEEWDTLVLVGTNPLVSMQGALGVNPARNLKIARQRGMKLIVIDPRVSECAKFADLHIQCRPGQDSVIMSAIVRELLHRDLFDHDFVAAETTGLAELRAAVEPFTPTMAAARAGIAASDIIDAATLMSEGRRGAVPVGTGPNMSGRANSIEYLAKVMMTLRGWWRREGDVRSCPGVLIEPRPAIAAAAGPTQAIGFEPKLRTRGLARTAAGMPTAALAEEILAPGPGQIKALITIGGNPAAAFPDQQKTYAAMRSLDLLVSIDPTMSNTARLSHYVLAPRIGFETETNSAFNEWLDFAGPGYGFSKPYAQITPPIVSPPEGSDLLEDWEFFYDIARHMGLEIQLQPASILDPDRARAAATAVDMENRPSTQDVWRMIFKGSPVPYDEVRASPEGRVFQQYSQVIGKKPADWTGRLEIGAKLAMDEISEVAREKPPVEIEFPLKLISRRLNDIFNSNWHDNSRQLRKWRYNPAFINPADLNEIDAATGDVIEIASSYGVIRGVAEASPDIRAGCVSMSHSWGGNPDEADDPFLGASTSRLVANDESYDALTGIPRMSSVPVRIKRLRMEAVPSAL